MGRRWKPGKTQVKLDGVDHITVVAREGSVDARPGIEFRIYSGSIGVFDADQSGRPPGRRVVRFDREGRTVRALVPTRLLKGYQPGQHCF